MSVSTAIGLVSSSLRSLLVGEMQLSLAVDVTVLAPDEPAGDRRVNLYLYRMEQNPFLRNLDPSALASDPRRLVPAPLSLELFYLLTSYAPNDPQEGNVTAQQLLGEAMRVFYEHPVLPARYLAPGLDGAREQLQMVMRPLDPEELSRIWTTFGQPFRLSVLYQVSTVQLDVRPERQLLAAERVRAVGVPSMRQPPGLPVVSSLAPAGVRAGATLTFTGEHLSGWRAAVSIGGRAVLEAPRLTDDTITATVPPDLMPGFYDARVDVAGLFRRTFTMEVTA
jgi:hypothetical protein